MNKKGRKDKGFSTRRANRFPDCLYQMNCAITDAMSTSTYLHNSNIHSNTTVKPKTNYKEKEVRRGTISIRYAHFYNTNNFIMELV